MDKNNKDYEDKLEALKKKVKDLQAKGYKVKLPSDDFLSDLKMFHPSDDFLSDLKMFHDIDVFADLNRIFDDTVAIQDKFRDKKTIEKIEDILGSKSD